MIMKAKPANQMVAWRWRHFLNHPTIQSANRVAAADCINLYELTIQKLRLGFTWNRMDAYFCISEALCYGAAVLQVQEPCWGTWRTKMHLRYTFFPTNRKRFLVCAPDFDPFGAFPPKIPEINWLRSKAKRRLFFSSVNHDVISDVILHLERTQTTVIEKWDCYNKTKAMLRILFRTVGTVGWCESWHRGSKHPNRKPVQEPVVLKTWEDMVNLGVWISMA